MSLSGKDSPVFVSDNANSCDSLSDIFVSNMRALRHYIASFFNNDHDVEDVLQDVYLRVAERSVDVSKREEEIHRPKAFLYKVARNLSLNLCNSAHARLVGEISDEVANSMQGVSLESMLEAQEGLRDLCAAVEELPGQCGKVFALKKIDGMGNKEIAQQLGIGVSTVDKHLARALLMLKNKMRKRGHLDGQRDRTPPVAASTLRPLKTG